LRHRRSQPIQFPPKARRPSIDTINSTVKQNFQSTAFHLFTEDNDLDELIDNDTISDVRSTTLNPLDSSILSVKSIIPSAGPQPTNHHLLQHR